MSFLAQKQENELFSFQLDGNHNNWKYSITKAPNDNVLPFNFTLIDTNAITVFEARKVSIVNDIVTLLETINLFGIVTINQTDNNYSLDANEGLSTNLEQGIYYYHFSDGTNVKQSQLFCIDESISDFVYVFLNELNEAFVDENDKAFVTF